MILGPIKLALRIAGSIFTIVVLYFVVTFVQIWMTGHHHSSNSAQGILVFGTTENNGKASPELAARLDQALWLYNHHRAHWVIVTGGKLPGDTHTEAGVSATYLEARGVAANNILLGSGNDTWQNVSSVIKQMRSDHITTVLTVTDPFHEYRAMAISSSQGLVPSPSPVSNSPTSNHGLWRFYMKETLEVGIGRIIGYARLSSWTTSLPTIPLHSGG